VILETLEPLVKRGIQDQQVAQDQAVQQVLLVKLVLWDQREYREVKVKEDFKEYPV
jgi:hypothetical protein